MTEAEVIEKINKKMNELEEKRAANASSVILNALESEIADLQESLSGVSQKSQQQQVFLDECAG